MKIYLLLITVTLTVGSCKERQANNMTEQEYFDKAQYMWQNFVPESGQAETVQGELIRAIEKLRDEAQRNGNINFSDDCHRLLIEYLRKNLSDERYFSKDQIKLINQDLDTLNNDEYPYTEDDIYNRLTNRIVDWYIKNNKPIKHIKNQKLYC